ncbi:MAG: VWA domain-containing protein [Acidobacteriia bacterium]|nr:VWA domain-containing protein [Terriglobia bacterium]
MSMHTRSLGCFHQIAASVLLSILIVPPLRAQVQKLPPGQKAEPSGAAIRVNVALVQTDVMVFDRQGHFVSDLKPEQFELRVDGKVQPISFFELVSAGSSHDEEIWAKAEAKPTPAPPQPAATGTNPGRTLLLFLDDWHLAEDSVMRSRAALTNLINASMGPRDRFGIFAASGQLGFAQQLTNDKGALLATLEKLNFQSAGVKDLQWPPMTEAQAVAIEQNDWDAITYFVQAITGKPVVRDNRGWTLPFDRFSNLGRECDDAEKTTRRRAADLAQTSAGIGERFLSALRNLLRAAEALPGRKLVFLLSDGFVLQPQRGDIVARIGEVTTAAARAGILIYTLDARGLVVGLPDARTKRAGDMTGALAHSGVNEVTSSQDALNALAADTGGRFLKNTNALDTALITTLTEISRYYLLGWHLNPDALLPGKYSTIRASIKGRSGLSVRVRQGSLDLSQLVSKKQGSR